MQRGDEGTTVHPILRAQEQISGYRLLKRRGRGGVAEVWEAESPAGYRVALKLVHLSTDLRSGELRALKITREIRHPALLGIFGTWQVEGLLVISMELADRSLWDRFLEANVQGLRGIPRGELLGYLQSVAEAIDYLNEYKHSIAGQKDVGIQHRDLKPQNILLLDSRAKVADFGLARIMERGVASHTGPCTLPYAAPEFFGGKTARQSDQYALAVTYCQLRSGWMPFPGTTAQITFGHLYLDPALDGLPAPERSIVARALAKKPEDRWPDCQSFITALASLDANEVPDAIPRERDDIDDDARDHSGLSGSAESALISADSDFIPVDTPGVELAAARRIAGMPLPPGATILDWLSESVSWLRKPAIANDQGERPTSRLAAWRTVLRRKRALLVACAVLVISRSARWTRTRGARMAPWLRRAAPSRETRAAWNTIVRARLAQVRRHLGAAASRVARATRRLWMQIVVRVRAAAPPREELAGWMADLRPDLVIVARRAALVGLALIVLTRGVWTLTAHSRTERPSDRTAAANIATRLPASGTTVQAVESVTPVESTLGPHVTSASPEPKLVPKADRTENLSRNEKTHIDVVANGKPKTPEADTKAESSAKPAPEQKGAHIATVGPRDNKASDTARAGSDRASSAPEPSMASKRSASSRSLVGLLALGNWPAAALFRSQILPTVPTPLRAAALSPGPPDRGKVADRTRSAAPVVEGSGEAKHPTVAVVSRKIVPTITLPSALSVLSGKAAKLAVRIQRDDISKPVHLDFHSLPHGITVADPTIPAGSDTAELIVSAARGTPPTSTEVDVEFTEGSQHGEAKIKLDVQLPPAVAAYQRGQAELNRRAYAQAAETLSEAIRLDPESFDAIFHRGIAYYLDGQARKALADYTEAIRLKADSVDAHLARAKVQRDLGNHQRALDDYTDAIRLKPDVRHYLARAALEHDMGAYDKALADYEEALRLRRDDPAVRYRRGVTRYVMGDAAGAIEDFTEFLHHDPKHAGAYRYRGDAYARLGEFSKAAADHDTFERLNQPAGRGADHR